MEFTKDETNELRELANDFIDRLETYDYTPNEIKKVDDLLNLGFHLMDSIRILELFYDVNISTGLYEPVYSRFALVV